MNTGDINVGSALLNIAQAIHPAGTTVPTEGGEHLGSVTETLSYIGDQLGRVANAIYELAQAVQGHND